MNRTDRLVGILLELQARGELRAQDLAERFEVSVRTVYRDVQALSETGVPVVATPGKGYRLMEGYFLPPLSLSAPEAALLALGGEFVRDRVDPELRQAADDALRKLAAVLPPERREEVARRRRELLFSGLRRRPVDPRLGQWRTAIRERRVVRMLYHAYRRPAPEPRTVEPVLLIFLAGSWQVAAYCRLRQGPRLFRLDRVDRLEVTPERFEAAERHQIRPDPEEDWEGLPEVRVRFDAAVVRWVRERQPYFFRREEEDAAGPVFVYVQRDERDLVAWLLSWGGAFQVLSPASLCRRVAAEARLVLARHRDRDAHRDAHRDARAPAAPGTAPDQVTPSRWPRPAYAGRAPRAPTTAR
jgi:predicted DNA-binding transcriptional regulator YafY